MIKTLRIISIILVFSLTITAFTACNGEPAESSNSNISTNSSLFEETNNSSSGSSSGSSSSSSSSGSSIDQSSQSSRVEISSNAVSNNSSNSTDSKPKEEFYYQNAYINTPVILSFGVINHCNLFEPNQDITYYFTVSSKSLNGKKATVTFKNDDFSISKTATHTISFGNSDRAEARGSFKASKNGIYTFELKIDGVTDILKFNVGIVPKSKQANGNFLFGTQPYYLDLMHSYTTAIEGQSNTSSMVSILDTIEWLGYNMIRENGISWSDMQKSAADTMNFTYFDRCLDAIEARNMKLMWIIGGSTSWSVMKKYSEVAKGQYWRYPPEKEYWDKRITAIANHYKNRDSIIYEIWNEADWEFFMGTEEEYLTLLDSACRILKGANKNNFVIPSALVSNWETSLNPEVFAKDSAKYYSKYKQLYDLGLINTLNIHNHALFIPNTFFEGINSFLQKIQKAGFTSVPSKPIVSEAGLWSKDDDVQSAGLMSKILWYRANNYGGYVAYTFRTEAYGDDSELTWQMFNSYLQPRKSAIAYATLINFLGQSNFIETIPNGEEYTFADIYYENNKSIVPIYSVNNYGGTLVINTKTSFKVYDIYGNQINKTSTNNYVANKDVIYLVFDGKVKASDFSWR